jgi:hypothetical protein
VAVSRPWTLTTTPSYEAAVAEDRGAYEEALREYMRAGRLEALAIRRAVA